MNEDPNLKPETDKPEQEGQKPAQSDQPPVTKPEDTVDFWKQKFSNSSSEANLLSERNKVLEAQLADRNSTKEPTDSDFRAAFPSWDSMSDTEKELARRTVAAERTAGTAAQKMREMEADRSWNTSIELAIASNSALQGKESAFRQYASRPQYRNAPMDVLVPAFLSTQSAPAAPAPTPAPQKPALLTGTGGPKETPKPKGLSPEDLAKLRTSDPKGYMNYLKTHELDIDV